MGQFHVQDGLSFERLEDGGVRVAVGDFETDIPAASWGSAVASVSATGETGDTFQAAWAFHAGASPSVVERIAELDAEIRAKQAEGWGDPRELALALTHLEDVQMRFTRARAKATGVFRPVDLERVEAREERARFEQQAAAAAQEVR